MEQGNNFGIGLVSASDTGNVIEENTILGNTNGVFLAPGVAGNVIKNLADKGANTFRGNRCLTSINAPCPALVRPSTPP